MLRIMAASYFAKADYPNSVKYYKALKPRITAKPKYTG
jgi:hypothetical protein